MARNPTKTTGHDDGDAGAGANAGPYDPIPPGDQAGEREEIGMDHPRPENRTDGKVTGTIDKDKPLSEGQRRLAEYQTVEVKDAQSKRLSDLQSALKWALDEINELSNSKYQVAYPQGIGHHYKNEGPASDASRNYYRAVQLRNGKDPDAERPIGG